MGVKKPFRGFFRQFTNRNPYACGMYPEEETGLPPHDFPPQPMQSSGREMQAQEFVRHACNEYLTDFCSQSRAPHQFILTHRCNSQHCIPGQHTHQPSLPELQPTCAELADIHVDSLISSSQLGKHVAHGFHPVHARPQQTGKQSVECPWHLQQGSHRQ